MKNKKLIAFDMYNTFVCMPKSSNPYRDFFSQLDINELSSKQLHEVLQISNKNIEDILPMELDSKNIDNLVMQLASNIDDQLSGAFLYEDFLPTIEKLKELGYETAVVSNLSKPYAYPLTHLVPKDTFDYQLLSYELGMRKPDIGIFDHLKEISGYGSDEIVMVGDSLKSDVQGAKNADISPIHIDRTSQGIQYHQEHISISSLSQLLDVLNIKKLSKFA